MNISIDDIRKSGYCARGARSWFRQHEMDFAKFLREGGMDSDEFISRGDHLAQKVVDKKIAREQANG